MTAVTHRIEQGVRALLAFTQTVDYTLAARYLNETQLALFKQMTRSEQLHSLNVLRDVLAQGATPSELAVAALLHDVGKLRYPMAVWQKTLAVLVRIFFPRRYRQWGHSNQESNWLMRPFIVACRHASWSAELVAQTGASDCVVWLVANHGDYPSLWAGHPYADLLGRLYAADNEN